MKPMRAILWMKALEGAAFRLSCGHIVYRRASELKKCPSRLQCELCERDALEKHERQLAYERGRDEIVAKVRAAVAGSSFITSIQGQDLLDTLCTKVSNESPSDSEKAPE